MEISINNVIEIASGLYVDPHYIPYLDEYLKYIHPEKKGNNPYDSYEAYGYIKYIQVGYVPYIYNRESIPHIRKLIPDWFRPCECPLAQQVIYNRKALQRYFIYENEANEIIEVMKEYPKTPNIYINQLYLAVAV